MQQVESYIGITPQGYSEYNDQSSAVNAVKAKKLNSTKAPKMKLTQQQLTTFAQSLVQHLQNAKLDAAKLKAAQDVLVDTGSVVTGLSSANGANQTQGNSNKEPVVIKVIKKVGKPKVVPAGDIKAPAAFTGTGDSVGFTLPRNELKFKEVGPAGDKFQLPYPIAIGAPLDKEKLYKASREDIIKAVDPKLFQVIGNKQSIASIFADDKKAKQNFEQKNQYLAAVKATKNDANASNFKALQSLKKAQWDATKNEWKITDEKLNNKFTKATSFPYADNFNTSNALMNIQIDSDTRNKYIPALVNMVVNSNTAFSNAGLGPVSRGGLPFMAGRYIDKVTGRIRVLPKASQKYINPLDYEAKLSYFQARLINKWNEYIQAEQNLIKFNSVDPSTWLARQQRTLEKKIKTEDTVYKDALTWMQNQYMSYEAFLPVSRSSSIVLGSMQANNQLAAFKDLIFKTGDAKTIYANEVIPLLQKAATSALTAIGDKTDADIRKRVSVAGAFSTYIEKAAIKVGNIYKTLIKSYLPKDLNEQVITKYDEFMNSQKSLLDTVGGIISKDGLDKVFANVAKGTSPQQFNNLASSLTVTGGSSSFMSKFRPPPKAKIISKQIVYDKPKRLGLTL